VSICLDAFALLCWLQDEPGAELVEGYLAAGSAEPESRPRISLMNLGEVFYRLARTRGREAAEDFWSEIHSGAIPVRPVAVTRSRVLEAAKLKARYRIAYADAFAIELARDHALPLLTGDPEMRAIENQEPVELRWLPMKPRTGGNR
jgi:predicted nucleic acid-binding protein